MSAASVLAGPSGGRLRRIETRAVAMPIALCALAAVVLPANAGAADPLPALDRGASYESVRGKLKDLGWRPHEVPKAERRCDRREQTCDAYLETESCAATGTGACAMLWERGDSLIAVETRGLDEDEVTVERVSCRAGC